MPLPMAMAVAVAMAARSLFYLVGVEEVDADAAPEAGGLAAQVLEGLHEEPQVREVLLDQLAVLAAQRLRRGVRHVAAATWSGGTAERLPTMNRSVARYY